MAFKSNQDYSVPLILAFKGIFIFYFNLKLILIAINLASYKC